MLSETWRPEGDGKKRQGRRNKVQLTTKIDPGVKELLARLADVHDQSPSEYLRWMVLRELERYGMLAERLQQSGATKGFHTLGQPGLPSD